jgi:anti-sigma regulatory factor (Ser/Thr protein kinase)
MGASADTVASLVLATDEVVTNIIVHGYEGREGTIEIEMERQGQDVLVRVRDQAPPFDSTAVPPPDLTLPLEKRPLGGLGVYLARRVVDEMSYRAGVQGGNELTLVKRVDSGC